MTTKTLTVPSKFGNIPAILYTPSKPIDLCVVFLNGRGENGNGEMTGSEGLPKLLNSTNHANLLLNAEKYGFSVLAPQLVPKFTNWQVSWIPEYTNACIDYALTALTKQPKVGLTGLSQGGGGCFSAMTNSLTAGKIMFCISICPTPQYEGDFSLIAKNHIPLWNFHAVNDTTVSIAGSRNMIASANKHNPDPPIKYEEFASGSHYIWGQVYERSDIYNWAMLQYNPVPIPEPIPEPDPVVLSIQTTIYASGKIETKKLNF
jgi:predicted peptidase